MRDSTSPSVGRIRNFLSRREVILEVRVSPPQLYSKFYEEMFLLYSRDFCCLCCFLKEIHEADEYVNQVLPVPIVVSSTPKDNMQELSRTLVPVGTTSLGAQALAKQREKWRIWRI
jgi:hypothetical protein